MEISNNYKKIVADYLQCFSDKHLKIKGNVKANMVVDDDAQIYILTMIGWEDEYSFIYDILLHIEIIKEKIWIQLNDTEVSVYEELLEKGIKATDLIMAASYQDEKEYLAIKKG